MATSYMTAAQVGSYFVTQYYSMLQQRPEFVHQLYSDASTMLRIDGHTREAATAMMQIHTLVMSTRFTSIEIKTAHSLESWNGGVIVMVTGSVQIRDFSGRKKFAQTFFLAPQEKGFFVLNDIFHFIEDDHIHPYPVSLMGQSNLNTKLNAVPPIPEPVPNYMMSGGMQVRDYMPPGNIKENGTAEKYSMAEQRVPQTPEVENVIEDNPREQANGFIESTGNLTQEVPLPPPPTEESVEEPQKHTYASVLRAAKMQSAPSAAPLPSSNKATSPGSEWQHGSQQNSQQSAAQQPQQSSPTLVPNESIAAEISEDVSTTDDRGEIKSVYVRNLSPTVSPSEIEEEFMKFGQLSSEGVAIRRLKDTEVCYAFVEFEDISSVHSAIKAGAVQIAGRQVYIEERRANSSFARGRRGRGRASYQPDGRGRFGGRAYGRGSVQGGEREFNRPRGNGYYRQTGRQDQGYSANHASRNGQSVSE